MKMSGTAGRVISALPFALFGLMHLPRPPAVMVRLREAISTTHLAGLLDETGQT